MEKFKEYLRMLGIDHAKFESDYADEDKAVIRRGFDVYDEAMSNRERMKDAMEKLDRQRQILTIAQSCALTAAPHISGELVSEGIRQADSAKTVDDAKTAIMAKARDLMEKQPNHRTIDMPSTRVVVSGGDGSLSCREIASAFTDQTHDRSAIREASASVVKRIKAGEPEIVRAVLEEVNKKGESAKGVLRCIDEGGNIRTMTSNSQNIVIQNVSTALLQKEIEEVPSVAEQLVTIIPSSTDETTFPELDADNGVRYVKQGDPFPLMGSTDREVRIGHRKYGGAIAQTREAQIFDNIGRFSVLLKALSRQLLDSRDRLVLARICDSTAEDGKYINYPGSSDGGTALYSASEDADGNTNLIEDNGLVDYTDLDAAIRNLKSKKRRDGTFVMARPRVLLCPVELELTAWKIMNSIYCPPVTGETANSMQVNPYGPQGMLGNNLPRVVAHPLVATFNGNTTDWYLGDPQQQFYERRLWAPEVLAKLAGVDPLRDIVSLWVGSFCCEIGALSTKHFVKCEASSGS